MHWLKLVHISAALISISGFILRGIWMWRSLPLPQQHWVKVTPHVVDTVLLMSAIALMLRIHQYPLVSPWLSAKVVGLLVYIGLGMVALRYGKTKLQKRFAWFLAIVVFVYIVSVARTRSPMGFLLW